MIAYLIVYYACAKNLRAMHGKMLVTLTCMFYASVYCVAHCILAACTKLGACCLAMKRKHPTPKAAAVGSGTAPRGVVAYASKSLSQLPPPHPHELQTRPRPPQNAHAHAYHYAPSASLFHHLHPPHPHTTPAMYYSLPNLAYPPRASLFRYQQPQPQPVYFYPPQMPPAVPPPPPFYPSSLSPPSPSPPLWQSAQPQPQQQRSAMSNFPGWSDDTAACLLQLDTNYTIGGVIGRGAYSVVYEATHRHTLQDQRKFAVKRTHYKTTEERARFIEENRLQTVHGQMPCYLCFDDARRDQHCIVSVWDCFRCTLSSTLPVLSLYDRHLPKKEQLVAKIVHRILRKLHYLHFCANLIHHDLKPQNILLTNHGNPCDSEFDVFIIDYGFSVFNHYFNGGRQCAQSEDKCMIPRYTLGYCAWELLDCIQRKNVCYTQQIDMYALGVITMELLLGRNCIVGNQARNQFVHAMTQQTMQRQKIGAHDRLMRGTEYDRFMRSCKVKFHREFFSDKTDPTQQRSTIAAYVVQQLREYGYSQQVQHFVGALLHDDPNQRLNCHDALQHPFILSQY